MSTIDSDVGPCEVLHIVATPSARSVSIAVLQLLERSDPSKWYQSVLVEHPLGDLENGWLAIAARARGTPVVAPRPASAERSGNRLRLLLDEHHFIRSLHIGVVHVHAVAPLRRRLLTAWLRVFSRRLPIVESIYQAGGDALPAGLLRVSGPDFASTADPFTATTHADQVDRAYAAVIAARRDAS